ncbi:hypothetical protein QE152_g12675 [Popillia japonica]|uniref:Uncharacterized protein n=1 Tax=Popillia japonica TaxID=7064 RepID=A0AAW1LI72_POPJA
MEIHTKTTVSPFVPITCRRRRTNTQIAVFGSTCPVYKTLQPPDWNMSVIIKSFNRVSRLLCTKKFSKGRNGEHKTISRVVRSGYLYVYVV